jgi:hypothetical protein
VTDGSFVDCGGVEDVEGECQSLSMMEGGRNGRGVNREGKPSLAEFSKFGGRCATVRFAYEHVTSEARRGIERAKLQAFCKLDLKDIFL